MKLWEGALLSLTAFLAGYLLAWWQVFYGGARLFAPVLKGWAVLYPDFRLTPVVDLQQDPRPAGGHRAAPSSPP